jgi:hypothetical protein
MLGVPSVYNRLVKRSALVLAVLKNAVHVRLPRWLVESGIAALLFAGFTFVITAEFPSLEDLSNLARHRPVEVVTPNPLLAIDSNRLVDGDVRNLGFHTIDSVPNQRVTIDLGKVHSITKVVVYNRFDCCQYKAVPLRLELSEDGRAYRLIAERTEVFDRWDVDFSKTNARYVRLVNGSTYPFHLSEVQVY